MAVDGTALDVTDLDAALDATSDVSGLRTALDVSGQVAP